MKLAYELGCLEALIKLGATVLQKELSPAAKAFADRLSERTKGDTPQTLGPLERKAQRQFRHAVKTKMPELIGASENYQQLKGDTSGLNPEGIQRAKEQGKVRDAWIRSKGPQATFASDVKKTAPRQRLKPFMISIPQPPATKAISASADTSRAINPALAETDIHIRPTKARPHAPSLYSFQDPASKALSEMPTLPFAAAETGAVPLTAALTGGVEARGAKAPAFLRQLGKGVRRFAHL